MLYKNRKTLVHSPNADIDFFDIIAGILQGETFAPYMFIIFTNPFAWAGYDTRSIFKWSLTGLNSEFYP